MRKLEKARKIIPYYNLIILLVVGSFLIYMQTALTQSYFDKDVSSKTVYTSIICETLKAIKEPDIYQKKPNGDCIRLINFNPAQGMTTVRLNNDGGKTTASYSSIIFGENYVISLEETKKKEIKSRDFSEILSLIEEKNMGKFPQTHDPNGPVWIIEMRVNNEYGCIFRNDPSDIMEIAQKMLHVGKY